MNHEMAHNIILAYLATPEDGVIEVDGTALIPGASNEEFFEDLKKIVREDGEWVRVWRGWGEIKLRGRALLRIRLAPSNPPEGGADEVPN